MGNGVAAEGDSNGSPKVQKHSRGNNLPALKKNVGETIARRELLNREQSLHKEIKKVELIVLKNTGHQQVIVVRGGKGYYMDLQETTEDVLGRVEALSDIWLMGDTDDLREHSREDFFLHLQTRFPKEATLAGS